LLNVIVDIYYVNMTSWRIISMQILTIIHNVVCVNH